MHVETVGISYQDFRVFERDTNQFLMEEQKANPTFSHFGIGRTGTVFPGYQTESVGNVELSVGSTDDAGIVSGIIEGNYGPHEIEIKFKQPKTFRPKSIILTAGPALIERWSDNPVKLGFTHLSEDGFKIVAWAYPRDQIQEIFSYVIIP
jgi:hypothetical protein